MVEEEEREAGRAAKVEMEARKVHQKFCVSPRVIQLSRNHVHLVTPSIIRLRAGIKTFVDGKILRTRGRR